MAFIIEEQDLISFYMREDFAGRNAVQNIYINRGDKTSYLHYIHYFMETKNPISRLAKIAVPRSPTPAYF